MLMAVIIVLVIGLFASMFLVYQNMLAHQKEEEQKLEWLRTRELVALLIHVPRDNIRPASAAEQVFAALHGIHKRGAVIQEELSFEMVATEGAIRFYAVVPAYLRDFVEGQIYAQYPNIHITAADDYVSLTDFSERNFVGAELCLDKEDVYPIKTYESFEADPLAGITSVLSGLQEGEEIWMQTIIHPEDEKWQERGIKTVADIRAGKKGTNGFKTIVGLFIAIVTAITGKNGTTTAAAKPLEKKALAAPVEQALKGIEDKIIKLGFATKMRIISIAKDAQKANSNLLSTIGVYTQFNTNNLNNIRTGAVVANDENFFRLYWSRLFLDAGSILNITELASLYHFPSENVETPNIVWAGAKKSEPPPNLPLTENFDVNDLTVLGKTDFRQKQEKFGIKINDRLRHMYVIGKSGTGKSTLLENMILDDIRENRGIIVVDPHGELVEHVVDEIPDHRMKDTILIDPSDREYPVGLNLLEAVDDDLKGIVASGFIGILEKIFGNSWGPRMEHILRNCVLALLDTPGQTMLGIPKLLVEKKYRLEVMKNLKDPVVRDFWESEFEQWDPKFRTEAVAPIQNKVGQFLSTPTIRNIVGQAKSTIDIREVMDKEQILFLNLSKGKIGEDNSALLGAMLITKVQLAAMSRANLTAEARKNCFLYVDEFQNFATQSFATILSEARKYGLSLTMANQYIAQMEEVVREAVFGNVGSLISFRVGAGDAPFLAKEYAPIFDEQDLVNLDIHHIYLKMSIDGKSAQAFSAMTLPPIYNHTGHTAEIKRLTQSKYGRTRIQVEDEIAKWNKENSPQLVLNPAQKRMVEQEQGQRAMQPDKPFSTNVSSDTQESEVNSNDSFKENEEEAEQPQERLLPKNLINNIHYKEVARRGGEKWYFGVPFSIEGTNAPESELKLPDIEEDKLMFKTRAEMQRHQYARDRVYTQRPRPYVSARSNTSRDRYRQTERTERPTVSHKEPNNESLKNALRTLEEKIKKQGQTHSTGSGQDWQKVDFDKPVKL